MAGVLSSPVRFICHVPAFMAASWSTSLYNRAKHLDDIYDVITHGHTFLHGLGAAGKVTWAIFAWNMLMFAGTFFCSGAILFLVGLIDLGLAGLLLFIALQQVQFLPTTYSACGGASDWRNGTDGRNFFVVADASAAFVVTEPNVYSKFGSPGAICRSMVQSWSLTIALITLYFICGVASLVFSFATDSRGRQCHPLNEILYQPVARVVNPILAAVRFIGRYASKVIASTKLRNSILRSTSVSEKTADDAEITVLHCEEIMDISQNVTKQSYAKKAMAKLSKGHGDGASQLDDSVILPDMYAKLKEATVMAVRTPPMTHVMHPSIIEAQQLSA
ncbi:hypothetical protein G7Z17_g1718 [Cylindrodendrum hubeiense]|uniref:Uncharacterized protein n=1 Tax=Cylindrodendrum hubeiense TaxID=595255 RepID=A0A9P5HL18_9HYPO|nr:hypothetical protein G7Z17_g1718 [Cylindrodendrum hubeiense]